MNMHKYLSLILLVLSFALWSCDDASDPVRPAPETVRRTVLVYQVANNNGLAGNSVSDLTEMQQAVDAGLIPDDGRVLVYCRRSSMEQVLFELTKNGNDTLAVYSDRLSAVDPTRILEVLADVEKFAPSTSYGLILWGHGSGWMQDGITVGISENSEEATKRRSYGGDNGKWINVTDLAETLSHGPSLDFIYFDCCFMGGVEVAYELAGVTPYVAFSVMEIAAEGMPYDRTLGSFFANGSDAVTIPAETTVDYYREWQTIGTRPEFSIPSFSGRYCTMSVVDCSKVEALAEATKRLYKAAPSSYPSDMQPLDYGRNKAVGYYFDFGKYARDLCLDDAGNDRFSGASVLFEDFQTALEDAVIYNGHMEKVFGGVRPITYCSGLNTYILKNATSASKFNYDTLSWFSDVASELNVR